jgi:hypothetical protein
MSLDDLGDAISARLIIQIAQDGARIEDVRYQVSFRRRWRLSSPEREGLPAKSPRVLSTSLSDTGSRTIFDPSWVTAMRVPGAMRKEVLISEGITSWPFVLTVVIRRSMTYIIH